MRLLIVEDEPSCARLIALLLGKLGSVDIVDNVADALVKTNEAVYDLLIVDIQLKGQETGIDLVQELRKTENYAHIPMVACSAFIHPSHAETLREHGFNSFVTKPFSADEMINAVTDQLSFN